MNESSESSGVKQTDVEIARERTKQAGIVGWTAGIAALVMVSELAHHPTWPFVAGVLAVAAMMAFVCRGLIEVHFESWWTARPVILRWILRITLMVMIVGGFLLCFNFSLKVENNERRQSTVLNVGAFDPWFHFESVTEKVVTSGSDSYSSNSHSGSNFNLLAPSSAAGIVALFSLSILSCIRRWEKQAKSLSPDQAISNH